MFMAQRNFLDRLSELMVRACDALMAWQERRAGRYALMTLDERMLRDMGRSRCDAEEEEHKPFWRP